MREYVTCPFCGYNKVNPSNIRIEQGIQNGHKAMINHLYALCLNCERRWHYIDVWERIETMQNIEEVKED